MSVVRLPVVLTRRSLAEYHRNIIDTGYDDCCSEEYVTAVLEEADRIHSIPTGLQNAAITGLSLDQPVKFCYAGWKLDITNICVKGMNGMAARMSDGHVENGPIAPVLLSFALPVLLLQLLQELFNVTDCMAVRHFGGDYALAATGVASLVLSILINFFIGLSSGISGIASRRFGERSDHELQCTVNVLFRLAVAVGIGLSALILAAVIIPLSLALSIDDGHKAGVINSCHVGEFEQIGIASNVLLPGMIFNGSNQ